MQHYVHVDIDLPLWILLSYWKIIHAEGNMHITSVAVSIETMLLTEVPIGFLSVAILLAPHFSSAFRHLSDPTNKIWLGNYQSNPDFVSPDIMRVHRTNSAMVPNEEWRQQRQKCTFVCVCLYKLLRLEVLGWSHIAYTFILFGQSKQRCFLSLAELIRSV